MRAARKIITQADIDAPAPPQEMSWREALVYVDGVPGLLLTLIVLACFVAGVWALYAAWGISDAAKFTAAKG